ncbi:DNA-directed RNA polymerase III subunit RPC8 [Schistosoma haematobium]|uniref:DNA-directed RNA polymerase III subunit RPC8 n=1 Tax=Schistosoma haematobium TaxID=6185 RepID=A0A922LN97_SCHHA|nr:DNA-directed RNA polymerase III subunit RPC8 [Schistosoma haematobium]KAH9590267.1 DNA-directed RNA polymerase III subunit RPC8 [Schistosoma haematobium]
MFVLVSLKDTVVIKPNYIGSDMKEIMEQELNSRFCSKVIYKVGLCISLWDILKVEESFISDVDGAYYTTVSFRIVCFRPFIDEILIGIVKSLSKAGLRVSLNFFDDVFIPAEKLRSPSRYDYEQNAWIWEYAYEGETAELRIDKHDTIRFRVVEEVWSDPNPDSDKTSISTSNDPLECGDGNPDSLIEPKAPYTIIGSVVADGLGVTCWWVS